MSVSRSLFALVCALTGAPAPAQSPQPPADGPRPGSVPAPPPTDLADYVRKEDKSYTWAVAGKTETAAGVVHELTLTSQTWQDIAWTHKLQVFVPKGVKPAATMVLWNQGGNPSAASGLLGLQIAQKVGAPVAFLYGVPNQPLFGGKREDALIAETFVRFLATKDGSWPLLFPMVKSLVRAMDTLQAFATKEWGAEVKQFVVTGASKRGWTSWLTAASGDPRVKAIAPLVIDTLNFPAQMKNQVQAFGRPSEMVRDYTDRGLIPIPDTAEARRLWQMIDPWVYRARLTLPKMIINGANDPYWPLDALNSYWDDLVGEKHVLYVPNAGHDLREVDAAGNKELIPARAVNALAGFCRAQVNDRPMPKLTWVCLEEGGGCRLTVNADQKVKAVRVWAADADTRDFRKARWAAADVPPNPAGWGKMVPPPKTGFRAAFLEVEFEADGQTFSLCTQIRILDAKK